jgi:hypothetical protein
MREKTIIKRTPSGMPGLVHRNNGPVLISMGATGVKKIPGGGSPETHTGGAASKIEEEGKKEWIPWGSDDNFPMAVIPMLRKSTVGRSAVQMLTKAIYGQKLITYKVTGYNNGQEVMEQVLLPEWEDAKRQSNFNAVRIGLAQDYNIWSICMPEIRFNGNKTKVWGFDYHRMAHCRFAPIDSKTGRIPKIFVSANFPDVAAKDCQQIPVIDFIRYPDQIQEIKDDVKYFKYVMPTYWPDPINSYYPVAYSDSARSSGHIGIATSIPAYKQALFKNQMSLKYEIQIPWEWIEEMYPTWKKMGVDEQDRIIDDLYNEIIDCLTGAENAEKAIMSFYRTGKDGKPTGQWIIKTIDDKMRNDAYLPDAAASNSEILFAYMVNPAQSGQGNTGGSYAGGANNGGSNIREAGEWMRSLLKADRDLIYSFFEFFKMYNGLDMDIQLGVQDLVLTTLDTGSNTTKTQS